MTNGTWCLLHIYVKHFLSSVCFNQLLRDIGSVINVIIIYVPTRLVQILGHMLLVFFFFFFFCCCDVKRLLSYSYSYHILWSNNTYGISITVVLGYTRVI